MSLQQKNEYAHYHDLIVTQCMHGSKQHIVPLKYVLFNYYVSRE